MAQSSTLIKRLALAAVGQALPEASALSATLRVAQKGLLATVVAGVLLAGLIIVGLFGFYLYLVAAGVTQLTAIGIITLILFMLTVISGLVAERYLTKLPEVKQELSPFRGSNGFDLPVQEMLSAFMEGIATGGSTQSRYRQAGDVRVHEREDVDDGRRVKEFTHARFVAEPNGSHAEKRVR